MSSMLKQYYDSPENAAAMAQQVRKQSLTERLSSEKGHLLARVEEIDKVLDALKSAPQVEAVIDLIFKHA